VITIIIYNKRRRRRRLQDSSLAGESENMGVVAMVE
jgi:hypothetical protein